MTTPKPPAELTPAERDIFRRAAKAREAAGHEFAPADTDAIADYARSRVRIVELAEMLRGDATKADLKVYAMLCRQIDCTTELARRLAKGLELDQIVDPDSSVLLARMHAAAARGGKR
jgi:hypothetical protein